MFNGLGLAVSQTADRFIVAARFNLSTLAVYSVVLLATTIPINLVFRIIGTTVMARFYHAVGNESAFHDQIKFTSSLMALVGAFYAGGVIFLTNTIVPLVFGPKFVIGDLAVDFLGLTAFIRIVRSDPFTALMLTTGRTKRLAASNMVVSSSLLYIILFAFYSTSIESIFVARLLGEITSLAFTIYMIRGVPEGGRFVFSLSSLLGLAFVGSACVASYLHWRSGGSLVESWMEFAAYALGIFVWGAILLMRSRRQWTPALGGRSKI
jgi:O-antigen/teichoic acid export membrane protein